MIVLIHTSLKENFGPCTEIHCSIAFNSCKIKLARKEIILLSDAAVLPYKAGSRMDMQNMKIKFTLSRGAYSIDAFNVKRKVAVLQQRQDWEMAQIKSLQLVVHKKYLFVVSYNFLIAFNILFNYLQKNTRNKSTLPLSQTKQRLIHHLSQIHHHYTVNKFIELETM